MLWRKYILKKKQEWRIWNARAGTGKTGFNYKYMVLEDLIERTAFVQS
jgi:hypothetical protein